MAAPHMVPLNMSELTKLPHLFLFVEVLGQQRNRQLYVKQIVIVLEELKSIEKLYNSLKVIMLQPIYIHYTIIYLEGFGLSLYQRYFLPSGLMELSK